METVVYSCPFIPAEWIAAHRLRPSRILPHAKASETHFGSGGIGVCPYVRAFIGEVCSGARPGAVVLTTTCDQMRRASEAIADRSGASTFLFHVPTTWQTAAAQQYYTDELKRLGRFLAGLGGEAPTNAGLAEVMDEYDTARAKLRAARGRLSARQLSQAIASFHRTGNLEYAPERPSASRGGIPLALVGGPLLRDHFDLFDLIERAGGDVVLDATTSGERTLPAPFDRRRLRADPLGVLAEAYFGHIPDAFRRPNSQLYTWLKRETAQRGVRGILFRHYLWCDTWHAEAQRMKEWTELPLLTLVAGDEVGANGHVRSRVQSFLEMLR